MDAIAPFGDFIARLNLLIKKDLGLISITLENIFTMRLVGNKTHGDLAEIAISEFVNQYMYDFRSEHVGKNLYRSKSREEDISVTNEITGENFSVSLKAYGDGPLQLSTDKNYSMYPRLSRERNEIVGKRRVAKIFNDAAFSNFQTSSVLPLIYDEKGHRCNILVFNAARARNAAVRISREEAGRRRKHPVYRFYDSDDDYICEVRYGGAAANALQRGLWTHTRRAAKFFDSITNVWIDYSHNVVLVQLLSHALVSSVNGHESALEKIKEDIDDIKRRAGFSQ